MSCDEAIGSIALMKATTRFESDLAVDTACKIERWAVPKTLG